MEKNIERLLRGGQFMSLLDHYTKNIREEYQLKSVDLRILYYLSQHPDENTTKQIQSYFIINKGYISQTVDRLLEKKLIEAKGDPLDHRYIHYTVTKSAASLIRQMNDIWNDINEDIFEGIKKEDLKTFHKVANQIEENILKKLN